MLRNADKEANDEEQHEQMIRSKKWQFRRKEDEGMDPELLDVFSRESKRRKKKSEAEEENELFNVDGKNSLGPLTLSDEDVPESALQLLKIPLSSRDRSKWDKRSLEVPRALAERLQEYQRNGTEFLHALYARDLSGILGDEMGLGKTIQVISFCAACLLADRPKNCSITPERYVNKWRKEERVELSSEEAKSREVNVNNRRPILIVVPATVVQNWLNEFQKWGDVISDETWDVNVKSVHGPNRDFVLNDLENVDVILTTLGIIINAMKISEDNVWVQTKWDFCIVDEMHILLKNTKTEYYKTMKQLDCLKYGLTGTPYQNQPKELFNIFDLVQPNCFGSYEHFDCYYSKPMAQGKKKTASER